jgi:hypothetical protein
MIKVKLPHQFYFKNSNEQNSFLFSKKSLINSISESVNTIFYPGSGFDIETLAFFLDYSLASEIYYVDYLGIVNFEELKRLLENLRIPDVEETDKQLNDINIENWQCLWHPQSSHFENAEEISYYKILNFTYNGRKINLHFINTDAIGTYQYLLNRNIKIDLIVCQDHGGVAWTNFCGDSLLHEIAYQSNSLPEYLMITEGQEEWPNYRKVTEDFGIFGLCKVKRSIYQLEI